MPLPERLRGVIITRQYTNPHLPLPLPAFFRVVSFCVVIVNWMIVEGVGTNCLPSFRTTSLHSTRIRNTIKRFVFLYHSLNYVDISSCKTLQKVCR